MPSATSCALGSFSVTSMVFLSGVVYDVDLLELVQVDEVVFLFAGVVPRELEVVDGDWASRRTTSGRCAA